jgi:hypothetical protein
MSGPAETRPRLGLRHRPGRSTRRVCGSSPPCRCRARTGPCGRRLPPRFRPTSPRAEGRVPRVGGRPEALGLGHRPQPEHAGVGLSDHDRAGLAHPPHRGVVIGDPVFEGSTPVRGDEPFGLEAEVLHPDRHSRERPRVSGANRARLGQRALGTERDERVQARIEPLDRLERGRDELARETWPARTSAACSVADAETRSSAVLAATAPATRSSCSPTALESHRARGRGQPLNVDGPASPKGSSRSRTAARNPASAARCWKA